MNEERLTELLSRALTYIDYVREHDMRLHVDADGSPSTRRAIMKEFEEQEAQQEEEKEVTPTHLTPTGKRLAELMRSKGFGTALQRPLVCRSAEAVEALNDALCSSGTGRTKLIHRAITLLARGLAEEAR